MPVYNTDTTIAGGQIVHQDGVGAIVYLDGALTAAGPSLTIFGTVEGDLASANPDTIEGIRTEGGFFQTAVLQIQASGLLDVSATGASATAYGIRGSSWAPDISIHGRVDVTSEFNAYGIDTNTPSSFSFSNAGTIDVRGRETVFGVRSGSGAHTNTGDILVTGANGPTWGIALLAAGTVVNSGNIIVTDTTSLQNSVAISITQVGGVANVENSGVLQADVAIVFSTNGGAHNNDVTNSGVIRGDIVTGVGDDEITNTNQIFGTVFLGDGNDRYTGALGSLFLRDGTSRGIVLAGDGADHIEGGLRDEAFYGEAGQDEIFANGGDDWISGGAGADTIDGGTGIDTADYSTSGSGVTVQLLLGAGAGGDAQGDALVGIENLLGSGFADTLDGTDAANRLEGGAGNDVLIGRDGNDRLIGGAGADSIDGGAGLDTVDYSGSSAGVTISLTGGSSSGGDAQGDTLNFVEHANGSLFADVISGSSANNVLVGSDGDDLISGLAGNDLLIGGDGNDTIEGGDGDDSMYGEGNDAIQGPSVGYDIATYSNASGGVIVALYKQFWVHKTQTSGPAGADTLSGFEALEGSAFNDYLLGSANGDVLFGGGGDDEVESFGGADWLYGGDGNDLLIAGDGIDRLLGLAGNDFLSGQGDDDEMTGYDGDDTFAGGAGADTIHGDAGSDRMFGGDGNDEIDTGDGVNEIAYGDAGDDHFIISGSGSAEIQAGTGNDFIETTGTKRIEAYGEDGNDTIRGADADDYVSAGTGDDFLYGNGGADRLIGGAGADHIEGGAGDDFLWGFAGVDKFVFTSGFSAGQLDTIRDFEDGLDKIVLPTSLQNAVTIASSAFGSFVMIATPQGQIGILVEDVAPANLSVAGDFLFV